MILKNDNKGWSEADLTWETAFLPGWLPQKPLETLAFICKWSPLWTKEFNRKSNEQNQWVGSNQIGPWRWSGKRWARASLGPFWSNCCEGGGLLLPASRVHRFPSALLCSSFSHLELQASELHLWGPGPLPNLGSAKSMAVHLETLRQSKGGIFFFFFFFGLAERCRSSKPALKMSFLPASKCNTCA